MATAWTGETGIGAYLDAETLAAGEEVLPRALGFGDTVTATGNLYLTYFTARVDQTVASVRMYSGATEAAETPTLIRVGLYQIARDHWSTATLVASTATDTALFAAADTAYTKAFSAGHVMKRGERYALGLLIVTEEAEPTVLGQTVNAAEAGVAPRLSGLIAAQTNLPASFVASGVAVSPARFYGVLVP